MLGSAQIIAFKVLLVLVVFVGSSPLTQASGNFINIRLPKGISFDLPKNWIILDRNRRITLDTSVESMMGMSSLEQANSVLQFAANLYSEGQFPIAIINVRFYPDIELSQGESASASPSDVRGVDTAIRMGVELGFKPQGIKIKKWEGTELKEINNLHVFVTKYSRRRNSNSSIFNVILVRAALQDRSFTMTLSYSTDHEMLLKYIVDRIISSLWVSNISN